MNMQLTYMSEDTATNLFNSFDLLLTILIWRLPFDFDRMYFISPQMYFTLLCNISIFKDPSPWLEVTPQMKVENQKKPYGEESI